MTAISNDQVIVREFQPQDQERVIELFRLGLCSYKTPPHDKVNPWFVEMKINGDMGNIQQHYIEKERHNFWVAVLNGNVVGCVGAWPHSKTNGALELIRMSVDASIRRKGIATLLIKQVEKYAMAEGFSKVILDTGAMMKAACSFYERCGYKKKKTYSDKLGGIEVHVQPFVKDLR